MGVSLQCILNPNLDDLPFMEGKSLAMAYCGDAGGELFAPSPAENDIIKIDFGGSQTKASNNASSSESNDSLLTAIGSFIEGPGNPEWHEPASGLAAIKNILHKLKTGTKVELSPEFGFGGNDCDDLTQGVQYDLETLHEILEKAQTAKAKFHLAFDV
ncbi:MAG: hypothetical protein JWN25_181 [Verrucomicrobiales bacterium]|jgi:hypothetical protein|nr:hypothetical protein [Verrucomicrobiales bacterium]MDB6130414.1 hypothetical protein [Verrucomicrobiales bacterium]